MFSATVQKSPKQPDTCLRTILENPYLATKRLKREAKISFPPGAENTKCGTLCHVHNTVSCFTFEFGCYAISHILNDTILEA